MLLIKALRSSTYKFALICIAIFGLLVFVLFGFVYLSTVRYVQTNLDRSIATEQRVLSKAYRSVGRDDAISIMKERIVEEAFAGAFYMIADPSDRVVAGNLENWPIDLKTADGWKTFRLPDGAEARAAFETLPDGYRLLVGKKIDGFEEFGRQIRLAFLLIVAFIFVLAGTASIAITRRTMGRIEAINATTEAIMRSGLGERIPRRATRDEWDQLASNLNAMLDRIERLVDEVKEVGDNVAHDLRTPLARIRGRLEQAQKGPRDGGKDQVLIERSLSDLDDVLRMFSSLTRISRIEANAPSLSAVPVDLSKVAKDVADLFDAASEETGGRLNVLDGGRVFVAGDRDLLFDALANLVDNAIKHGRNGGWVQIEVGERLGRAMISVSDNGPGIPCSEHDQVLRRFYRLESSRHTPGNGLGLSLVAAVARFHDLSIEMADNAPGLTVKLHFPAPASKYE